MSKSATRRKPAPAPVLSPWFEDLVRISKGQEPKNTRGATTRLSPVMHELDFWKGQRYGYIVFTRPCIVPGYWWGKCMRCKSGIEKEYRLDRRMKLTACGCIRKARGKTLHKFRMKKTKKKR